MVLLSASVDRVGISRMRDFKINKAGFLCESALSVTNPLIEPKPHLVIKQDLISKARGAWGLIIQIVTLIECWFTI